MITRILPEMSHPPPNGPPDLRPIEVGEIYENPVTRERATILELPWANNEGRAVAEMTALVGARVVGEHRHPAIVERFTTLARAGRAPAGVPRHYPEISRTVLAPRPQNEPLSG